MTQPRYAPSQTIGPFFHNGLKWTESNRITLDTGGAPLTLFGTMTDGGGGPVTDAMLEFWSPPPVAGTNGLHRAHGFGRTTTDAEGVFRVHGTMPLETTLAGHRHAPHFEVVIFARGLLTHLYTRVYFAASPADIAFDPVMVALADPARAETLLAKPVRDGAMIWNIRLQGEGETVFLSRN